MMRCMMHHSMRRRRTNHQYQLHKCSLTHQHYQLQFLDILLHLPFPCPAGAGGKIIPSTPSVPSIPSILIILYGKTTNISLWPPFDLAFNLALTLFSLHLRLPVICHQSTDKLNTGHQSSPRGNESRSISSISSISTTSHFISKSFLTAPPLCASPSHGHGHRHSGQAS